MQQQFTNFKEFFKSIQILHAAMFMGVVMILIILKYVLGIEDRSEDSKLFAMIGIGLAISNLVLGQFIYTQKVAAIKKERLPVMERLEQYRGVFIMRLAFLEGAALVCLILHFLNGDPLLFYTCLFMVMMLAFVRPLERNIMEELGLSREDIQ